MVPVRRGCYYPTDFTTASSRLASPSKQSAPSKGERALDAGQPGAAARCSMTRTRRPGFTAVWRLLLHGSFVFALRSPSRRRSSDLALGRPRMSLLFLPQAPGTVLACLSLFSLYLVLPSACQILSQALIGCFLRRPRTGFTVFPVLVKVVCAELEAGCGKLLSCTIHVPDSI